MEPSNSVPIESAENPEATETQDPEEEPAEFCVEGEGGGVSVVGKHGEGKSGIEGGTEGRWKEELTLWSRMCFPRITPCFR